MAVRAWATKRAAPGPAQGQRQLSGGHGNPRSLGQWEASPAAAPGLCTASGQGVGYMGTTGREGMGVSAAGLILGPQTAPTPPSLLQKFPQTTLPLQAPGRTLAEKPQGTQLVLSHSAPVACGKTPDKCLSNSVSFSGPQCPIHQGDRAKVGIKQGIK